MTHCCPAPSMQHWFSESGKRGIEYYWDAGGFAGSCYELPNLSQLVRPVPRWASYN